MTKRMPSVSLVDAGLLLTVMVWATNFRIVKAALANLSPLAFVALRMVEASWLTLFVTWLLEGDLSLPSSTWRRVILLGFIGSFRHP